VTPPSRRVLEATQSPMNARRWSLSLECGHQTWVTSMRRPIAKTSRCRSCGAGFPAAPPPPVAAARQREVDAIARDAPEKLARPAAGTRCPRCHSKAPNARGCALCAPEELESRRAAERRRVPLAPSLRPAEVDRRRRVAKIRRVAEARSAATATPQKGKKQ
jgi:hypothetical protein